MVRIPIDRSLISRVCKKWKIVRMAFLGSVLRSDFRPDSDVDVMVSFDPKAQWSLLDMVDLKSELVDISRRDVDALEEGTIRNPIKKRCIYKDLEVVYESVG